MTTVCGLGQSPRVRRVMTREVRNERGRGTKHAHLQKWRRPEKEKTRASRAVGWIKNFIKKR